MYSKIDTFSFTIKIYFRILIIIFSILYTPNAFSQIYDIVHYGSDDGLIQSSVNDIIQDNSRNIWFATNGGLTKFDGKNYHNFTSSNGLNKSFVNSICKDDAGNIWIGYGVNTNLITRYDGSKFENLTFDSTFICRKIYKDKNNDIWVCTNNAGAIKIEPLRNLKESKSVVFNSEDGLSDNVDAVCEDKNGNIWFATETGIKHFNRQNLTFTKLVSSGLPAKEYTSITFDTRGILYVGTSELGLYKVFNPLGNTNANKVNCINSAETKFIYSLMTDTKGRVWVGTWGGGAYILENDSILYIKSENGLKEDRIRCFFEDQENNIWIGLNNNGVDYFRGFNYLKYIRHDGFNENIVYSLCVDHSGRIWSGTNNGIIIRDIVNNITNVISLFAFLKSDRIFSLTCLSDGRICAGSFKGGIAFINPLTLKVENTFITGLDYDFINTVVEDENKHLKIGTILGLVDYDLRNNTWSVNKILDNKNVYSIYHAKNGDNYYGIRNGGVFIQENNELKSARKELSNEIIPSSFTEDNFGRIWIATEDNGLIIYDKDSLIYLSKRNGLPSDYVTMIFYHDGKIWIGTNQGISWIDCQNSTIHNIGIQYGGIIREEGKCSSVYLDKNDNLWIGTNQGLLSININWLDNLPADLPIQITGYKINSNYSNVNPDSTIEIELKNNQNELTFFYNAFYFENPKAIKYQTYLEGFENGWKNRESETSINYGNLPPGKYNFKIKSSVDEIHWKQATQKLQFTILPPLWKRSWFLIILFFTIILLIYIFFKIRVKLLLKEERERSALNKSIAEMEMKALRSQMNPHFMFNALNSIHKYILEKEPEIASAHLSKFSKLMRLILENSQFQMVSLEKELEALNLYIQLEAVRYNNHFNYSIEVDDEIDTSTTKIPPMLLQPFVENSIWHGLMSKEDGGTIQIVINKNNSVLNCIIEDNGIGREKAIDFQKNKTTHHESLGMKVTTERLRLINLLTQTKAEFNIVDLKDDKNKSIGTRIELTIPFEN